MKCEPHFVLVYGRRSEVAKDEALRRLRAELMGDNEHLMSFDRLWFEPKADNLPSVRHTTRGFKVLHIPASYSLGPLTFDCEQRLIGRVSAADKNPLITAERKTFMRKRIPYWEEWSDGPRGICSMADRE